jgi:replication-associated recombination protein RarA
MKDGDTIEFEKNFTLFGDEDTYYTIKKNINLVGYVDVGENNSKTFLTTLRINFLIDNATVSIEGLWFEPFPFGSGLWLKNGANLTLNNCHFNFLEESKICALEINHSSATLEDLSIATASSKTSSAIIVKNHATLKLLQSTIFTILVNGDSGVEAENTIFKGMENRNSINVKHSSLKLTNSEVVGIGVKYPALWAENTIVTSKNSIFKQPGLESCVNLNNNSELLSDSDIMTSIYAKSSRIVLNQATINEIIEIANHSYLYSKGELNLLGQNPKKIDLYVGDESTINVEQFEVSRIFSPNFRLKNNSLLHAKAIFFASGKVSDLNWDVDETSNYFIPEEEISEAPEKAVSEENEIDATTQLNELVGLKRVKNEIDKMIKIVKVNHQRVAQGLSPIKQSLHSVFMGNPGTGKTTVARLMGQVLFENGVFSGDEFIYKEVSEADLVSNHIGETAIKTTNVLESASGGLLFIDEAYTLNKKDSGTGWGQEAIDTILKYMEDHRDDIMIVFAGYTKEMEEFLRTNPGLESRVPNKLIFDDYTADEIITIGEKILAQEQYILEDQAYYEKKVTQAYNSSMDQSNARWIRNFNEQLMKCLALRVVDEASDDITTIKNVDIDSVLNKDKFSESDDVDPLAELNNLIGIQQVKAQVARFVDQALVNKLREEQGLANTSFTLHSLFMGNPGTGKTTVARLLGQALYQKNIIRTKKFIEVSRSDLVAGYSGQTAIKTREVLQSALGGVLFIDEAYSLYKSDNDTFGLEAIDEILKFMEDYRDKIVIILAGYTREMHDFLQANSGLSSRIPNHFDFEDYSADEITQIGRLQLAKNKYQYNVENYNQIVKAAYAVSNDRSNGRWVRNLNERLLGIMSSRIASGNYNDLMTVTEEDLDMLRKEYLR